MGAGTRTSPAATRLHTENILIPKEEVVNNQIFMQGQNPH